VGKVIRARGQVLKNFGKVKLKYAAEKRERVDKNGAIYFIIISAGFFLFFGCVGFLVS